MVDNLMRLYVLESMTLICFMFTAIIATILDVQILVGIMGIFILLAFVLWAFTSRIILKLVVDGIISNEDRRNKDAKRNIKEDKRTLKKLQ